MLTPSMRNWFGRSTPATAAMLLLPALTHPLNLVETPSLEGVWCPERLLVTDALWGEGYLIPGGEIEILRLARPMGLSAAASLLLLGVGGGAAACSLVTSLGVWVNGFEVDPDLVAAAAVRLMKSNLGKRARIDIWDPFDPVFARQYYHHALILEPLQGQQPETILAAVSAALKPGGQLMMTEMVADAPLNPEDPVVSEWAKSEGRDPRGLPSEITVTRVLGRQGYDVRIVEDVSQRYMHQAIMGWRRLVRMLHDQKPTRRGAEAVLREVQFWLIRLRLMREGRLRMVRWHAIGGGFT